MRVDFLRYLIPLTVGGMIASGPAVAQTYEYTDPDGTVSYSDNPYEAGIEEAHAPPVSIIDMRGETVTDDDAPPLAAKEKAKAPTGVVPVGEPDFGYTMEGLTAITLTVKNDLDNPVTGIVVSMTLLDGAKEPLDAVTLKGPTGIAGRTEPAATLTLTGVANTPPDLIGDYEVTTSWSNLQKNAPPPPVATTAPTPTPTPPLTKEDLPVSRTQQKRILKQKRAEQEQGETP